MAESITSETTLVGITKNSTLGTKTYDKLGQDNFCSRYPAQQTVAADALEALGQHVQ
jgi:hypothetical protein